ncbi:hypothetical protein I0C86_31960 [Plantactinospora sp. S1510]|uniref:DUF3558 domain-containing protein n=1 Tax=Plantactinospora alkalitolerans TaxID=2789879 RepID=A0ABS0H505_9ACTN|nr:hypothetical protein [Plantactinospora alkalitolerans]MBF9133517.1 hypothetical protein [Plantactinospora alkalitolerans]
MPRRPGRLRRLAQAFLLVAALPLLATGCGRSDPPQVEGIPGAPPSPTGSSAGSTGKWSKLGTACPTLTGGTATSLRKTGPGTPSAADADTPVAQNVNCTWGEGTGSVGVSLYLNRSDGPLPADQATAEEFQQGFDKYVQDGSILHWKPEPGLEDKAYLGIHKDRVTIELAVLSSNARFTVYYQVKELDEAAWDAALAQHRDTMRGLAADVLDDLS